ncbi:MAG: biotin--protein ligase [Candidatus Altiarchaeota archaeon]|nr:biotin--protein ligase [Candidatus Altiarchaeota archaeon]
MPFRELDYKVPQGKLIRLRAQMEGNRIKEIEITGDFFLHPEERIFELEKALVGLELDERALRPAVAKALADTKMVGVSVDDIVVSLLKLRC